MRGQLTAGKRASAASNRAFSHASILAVAFLLIPPFCAGAAYEPPPTLQASEFLPPDWLRGDHHRIDPDIPTDGFLTRITIQSDFGTFHTAGPGILGVRLREIHALAALRELGEGNGFVSGIRDSAEDTGESLRQLAVEPATTLGGIPNGIRRLFESAYRSAKTQRQKKTEEQQGSSGDIAQAPGPGAALPGRATAGASSSEEPVQGSSAGAGQAAANALGFQDARRDLAKRLGVDPYTTNAVLSAKLDEVAWSAFAGHLSVRVATMFVPGGFVLSTSSNLADLVWDSRPGDLQIEIERSLAAMGVEQDSIDRLLRHRWYSLSMQVALAWALEQLDGVRGRSRVMPLALSVTSEAQARFVVQSLLMTARAHRMAEPLDSLDVAWTVVARDRSGRLVVTLPVDYLSWNPTIETFVQRQAPPARRRTLHIAGLATAYSRLKLEQYGWEVVENSRLFVPVLGYREIRPAERP
jgi:hypothetical protein